MDAERWLPVSDDCQHVRPVDAAGIEMPSFQGRPAVRHAGPALIKSSPARILPVGKGGTDRGKTMSQANTSLTRWVTLAAAVCTTLLGAAQVVSANGQVVFPGATWESRTPAEVGMDTAKLDQIAAMIGGHGCIVRNGYMVKTWGSQTTKGDWASASKPVLSTLLFFAIEEGRISGVDARVADWGWTLSAKDQSMTFRHLANMTGNYTRAEAPGAAWAYNDYNIQLYAKTLFDRVYKQSANDVATSPSRLGALQFQDGSLIASNNRLNTSVRDFARIGWFWANKGKWNGTQLLPQHYFDDYMKPHVPPTLPKTSAADPAGDYLGIGSYGGGGDQVAYGPGIYGFNWWFNSTGGLHPNAKTWPDAPDDTFQANGHWGREAVTVIPSLNIVLAYFGGATLGLDPGSSTSPINNVLKLLVQSVNPTTPVIALNKSQINRAADFRENPPCDTFTVANGGIGTLSYRILADQPWVNLDPISGTSTGEADSITVCYRTVDLPVGVYTATITVDDDGSTPAASNAPQTIEVTLTVKSVLPDLDFDGDVDQEDFGLLQACVSEVGISQPSPTCVAADFNRDGVVDQVDIAAFLDCHGPPSVLADKTCDDVYE